jgi:ribonuclease HII
LQSSCAKETAVPWIVGIDEAAYGPNLGPFVMTAAAYRLPKALAKENPWDFLSAAVCKSASGDHRLAVADSKQLYSPARGLSCLERSVLAILQASMSFLPSEAHGLFARLAPDSTDELRRECWYTGETALPVQVQHDDCRDAGSRLIDICQQCDLHWHAVQSVVVPASAFNALVDRWGTKGSVPGLSLVRLLRQLPTDGEPVHVYCDKHGGRNFYCSTLQAAFDDGMVVAEIEGAERSRYTVSSGGRRVAITFEPRADDNHFCVALASMVCKYLRELMMLEFNRFWQRHTPGLKATAGYPSDAKRFWEAILPTVKKLGLPAESIWRQR